MQKKPKTKQKSKKKKTKTQLASKPAHTDSLTSR